MAKAIAVRCKNPGGVAAGKGIIIANHAIKHNEPSRISSGKLKTKHPHITTGKRCNGVRLVKRGRVGRGRG